MIADDLLLTIAEVRAALGPTVHVDVDSSASSSPAMGEVIRGAASDSSFRRFSGRAGAGGEERPLTVGMLTLVFDEPAKAGRTFDHVAQAAHLRAEVASCQVAVETVTAPSGLVSYWGYVHKAASIVIVTLDTVDPQLVSISDLRALVGLTAERLERTS